MKENAALFASRVVSLPSPEALLPAAGTDAVERGQSPVGYGHAVV